MQKQEKKKTNFEFCQIASDFWFVFVDFILFSIQTANTVRQTTILSILYYQSEMNRFEWFYVSFQLS